MHALSWKLQQQGRTWRKRNKQMLLGCVMLVVCQANASRTQNIKEVGDKLE